MPPQYNQVLNDSRKKRCCCCCNVKKGSRIIGVLCGFAFFGGCCCIAFNPVIAVLVILQTFIPMLTFVFAERFDNSKNRRIYYVSYVYSSMATFIFALTTISTFQDTFLATICKQSLFKDNCLLSHNLIWLFALVIYCLVNIHWIWVLRQNYFNRLARTVQTRVWLVNQTQTVSILYDR